MRFVNRLLAGVVMVPALTITPEELDEGLRVLARAVRETA